MALSDIFDAIDEVLPKLDECEWHLVKLPHPVTDAQLRGACWHLWDGSDYHCGAEASAVMIKINAGSEQPTGGREVGYPACPRCLHGSIGGGK